MKADLLIHSAVQLLTLAGAPQRGSRLGELGIIEDGAVAIEEGEIIAVGPSADLRGKFQATQEISASGKVVLPGFVDPHTHLVWAGDRAAEFELRLAGASYMEIMAAGGGIVSTVRQTRIASLEDLKWAARSRARRMFAHGTTTAEAKTGYGLETETELRMLEAIVQLDDEGPLEVTPTFLGAHAIPEEYTDQADAYTDLICEEMQAPFTLR
jgi:imidazolonepropionase